MKEMIITNPSAGCVCSLKHLFPIFSYILLVFSVFECILKYIYFFASQSEPPSGEFPTFLDLFCVLKRFFSDEKFEQLLQSSGATLEELFGIFCCEFPFLFLFF